MRLNPLLLCFDPFCVFIVYWYAKSSTQSYEIFSICYKFVLHWMGNNQYKLFIWISIKKSWSTLPIWNMLGYYFNVFLFIGLYLLQIYHAVLLNFFSGNPRTIRISLFCSSNKLLFNKSIFITNTDFLASSTLVKCFSLLFSLVVVVSSEECNSFKYHGAFQ